MTDDYLQWLEPERLVAVAKNLRGLAVAQLEKLEETSKTSSRPPSSDSPYPSALKPEPETSPAAEAAESSGLAPLGEGSSEEGAVEAKADDAAPIVPEQGFSIECRLHHYYGATCACGHHSQAKPAQGACSEVAGRKVQLPLPEQVLIGPMLATFIASLSVRYRLSRVKIQEFLKDWQAVSDAYAALLTVIKTCRRRNLSPWPYLSEVIALRRKGLPVHPVPMPLPQAA